MTADPLREAYERGWRDAIEAAAQVVVARGFRIPSLAKLTDVIRSLRPPATPAEGREAAPLRVVVWCPRCGRQHVDKGEWATKPHRKHLCDNPRCGGTFELADVPTVGVEDLDALDAPPPATPGECVFCNQIVCTCANAQSPKAGDGGTGRR